MMSVFCFNLLTLKSLGSDLFEQKSEEMFKKKKKKI